MEIEQTITDLSTTLGRTKGIIERLKKEVEGSTLSRNRCKGILFDLKSNSEIIKQHFMEFIHLGQQQRMYASQVDLLSIVLIFSETYQNAKIESLLDRFISDINSLATYEIDNIQYYDDQKVKNRIYSVINKLEFFIETLDSKIFRQLSKGITGISKINELVGEGLLGLGENWAAAACYLCAMDIAVNEKRKELGLIGNEKSEKRKPFDLRFGELLSKLETERTEISKVIEQLPKHFWKIRTDVVHYGYSPNQEELDLICKWSRRIINTIS